MIAIEVLRESYMEYARSLEEYNGPSTSSSSYTPLLSTSIVPLDRHASIHSSPSSIHISQPSSSRNIDSRHTSDKTEEASGK